MRKFIILKKYQQGKDLQVNQVEVRGKRYKKDPLIDLQNSKIESKDSNAAEAYSLTGIEAYSPKRLKELYENPKLHTKESILSIIKNLEEDKKFFESDMNEENKESYEEILKSINNNIAYYKNPNILDIENEKIKQDNLKKYEMIQSSTIDQKDFGAVDMELGSIVKNSDGKYGGNVKTTYNPIYQDLESKGLNRRDIERAMFQKDAEFYDDNKQWLQDKINSKAYSKRLRKETNKHYVDEIKKIRSSNLNKPYFLSNELRDFNLTLTGNSENRAMGVYGNKQFNHPAFKDEEEEDTNILILPTDSEYKKFNIKSPNTIGIHEFTHRITNADAGLSKKAEKMYSKGVKNKALKSFLTPKGLKFKSTEDGKVYFMSEKDYNSLPTLEKNKLIQVSDFESQTEMDARRMATRYMLEKENIKSYEQKVTKKDLKKLKDKYPLKQGDGMSDFQQFLEIYTPRQAKKLLNKIAFNNNNYSSPNLT